MTLFLAFLIVYGLNLSWWWSVPAVVIWCLEVQERSVLERRVRFVYWIAWKAAKEAGKV